MKTGIRCILGGLASSLIMIVTSTIVHGFLFRQYWDSVAFMRPTDAWPFMPGVPISTIIWNIVIAWFFLKFHKSIPSRGFKKGIIYGFYLCILFVFFVELWNFLQFTLPFMTVIAGILTYIIALPLGGGVISVIYGKLLLQEKN